MVSLLPLRGAAKWFGEAGGGILSSRVGSGGDSRTRTVFSETKNNRLIQKDFIVCQIQLKLLYQICVFYNDHQNWGNHKKKLHGLKPEINKNIIRDDKIQKKANHKKINYPDTMFLQAG